MVTAFARLRLPTDMDQAFARFRLPTDMDQAFARFRLTTDIIIIIISITIFP